MRKFLITLLLVAGIGLFVFMYLRANPSVIPEGNPLDTVVQDDGPAPVLRTPQDYHIMEQDGGIPLAEAQQAGLTGPDYAYLQGLGAINLSDGVNALEGATVRGKSFDLGYVYNSRFGSEQYAEFNINGEWDELHFGFGFDDAHPSDPQGNHAIEVEIQADGKVVFGPEVIKPTDPPVFGSADMKGIHRVTFVSRRIGKTNMFTPLILDPFVRKYPE